MFFRCFRAQSYIIWEVMHHICSQNSGNTLQPVRLTILWRLKPSAPTVEGGVSMLRKQPAVKSRELEDSTANTAIAEPLHIGLECGLEHTYSGCLSCDVEVEGDRSES